MQLIPGLRHDVYLDLIKLSDISFWASGRPNECQWAAAYSSAPYITVGFYIYNFFCFTYIYFLGNDGFLVIAIEETAARARLAHPLLSPAAISSPPLHLSPRLP